ncbi:MAG: GNAT family N-acetyltransferase [Pseudomonadota bacterium]
MTAVRPLGADDVAAFEALRQRYSRSLGGPGTPAPEFGRALLVRPGAVVLGAFEPDELVGFAVLLELPEAVHATTCGGLDDLFVRDDRRGRGCARALLEAAVAEGRRRRWSHLRWIVPEDDAPAIRLYERLAERLPYHSYLVRLDPRRSL